MTLLGGLRLPICVAGPAAVRQNPPVMWCSGALEVMGGVFYGTMQW